MKKVIQRTRFKRDLKKQIRRGKDREKLITTVRLLASNHKLPDTMRPHKLVGVWRGLSECHIEPDWLLIYDVTDEAVILVRTGSHSDLFTL